MGEKKPKKSSGSGDAYKAKQAKDAANRLANAKPDDKKKGK
jgi:hypothetical protein